MPRLGPGEETDPETGSGPPVRPRRGLGSLLPMSLFAFGYNAQFTGLLLLVVPKAILALVGPSRSAQALSVLVIGGSIMTVVLLPVIGTLSDRLVTRMGRRRPIIFAGILVDLAGLALMAESQHYVPFAIGDLLVQVGATSAWAAYQGLIPDLVPEEQRGTASGLVGFMEEIAIVVGILLPSVLPHLFFPVTMIVVALFTLPLLLIREPNVVLHGKPLRDVLHRLREYGDFGWVFLTRFLVILGFVTLENYIFYYVRFSLGARHPTRVVTEAILAVTLSSAVSVILAGIVADRTGRRKIIVIASGLLQGIASAGFFLVSSTGLIDLFAIVFGLGYGAYMSSDWALAMAVLPDEGSSGRDLGIWGIAYNLPSLFAGLIAGILVPIVTARVNMGAAYRTLFLLTFVYFLLGSLLVRRVRSVA